MVRERGGMQALEYCQTIPDMNYLQFLSREEERDNYELL